ncbi:SIMPL domain-containing protein [Patescibacteria group bacterium]|nr:SIMPL domain-containing protein [Patescibacteria group bacterium]
MKKNGKFLFNVFVIFLAILGLLKYGSGLTWSSRTVTIPKESPFVVSAEGEIYVKPDLAEISLGVEKEADEVIEAQNLITEVNNKLIADLKELGVKEKDIKTNQYSINPRYEYDRDSGERRLAGYQASASISVKTKDFEKISQIIEKATLTGANRLNSLNFSVEDRDEALAEARDQAIAEAKEKAQDIAKAAGLSLGRLINVSVYEGGGVYPETRAYSMKEMDGVGGGAPIPAQVEAGETKISVTVNLSYEI